MSVLADVTQPCLQPIAFQKIQKHFSESAQSYKQAAQLQERVGLTLLSKLMASLPLVNETTYLSLDKQHNLTCVDLGCGPGLFTERLNEQFNTVVGLDLASDMLQVNTLAKNKVQANSHALPFLTQSVDVFYSSLMVQWCDLGQVLQQIHSALKPNGKAFVATLVDGSLFELEQAWSKVDSDKHIHEYLTPEQISLSLKNLPWSQVESSTTTELLWFANARMLAKELKSLGANFVQHRKHKGLITKNVWQQMEGAYQSEFYNQQHQGIPATYQVMYIELTK
jgi:malonyl-CoA O-methyltransferase